MRRLAQAERASLPPTEDDPTRRERNAMVEARGDCHHTHRQEALHGCWRTLRGAAVLTVAKCALDAHAPRTHDAALAQAEAVLHAARHGDDWIRDDEAALQHADAGEDVAVFVAATRTPAEGFAPTT